MKRTYKTPEIISFIISDTEIICTSGEIPPAPENSDKISDVFDYNPIPGDFTSDAKTRMFVSETDDSSDW